MSRAHAERSALEHDDHDAMREVRDLCDTRRIVRKRRWGTPLKVPHTQEWHAAYVEPRLTGTQGRPRTSPMFTRLRRGDPFWQVLDEFVEPRTRTEGMAGTSTNAN